jgi:hypothetical protein
METEKIFADGFIWKKPRENAPDFVLGSISIKGDEAVAFINKYVEKGWLNLDVKKSKSGKIYMELNTWKPQDSEEVVNKKFEEMTKPDTTTSETLEGGTIDISDIPFN